MSDYLKSDNCEDCGGEGFRYYVTHQSEEYIEHEKDQCRECERLASCSKCYGKGFNKYFNLARNEDETEQCSCLKGRP